MSIKATWETKTLQHLQSRPRLYWTPDSCVLAFNGQKRFCEEWMPREEAMAWCYKHDVNFIDVEKLAQAYCPARAEGYKQAGTKARRAL